VIPVGSGKHKPADYRFFKSTFAGVFSITLPNWSPKNKPVHNDAAQIYLLKSCQPFFCERLQVVNLDIAVAVSIRSAAPGV